MSDTQNDVKEEFDLEAVLSTLPMRQKPHFLKSLWVEALAQENVAAIRKILCVVPDTFDVNLRSQDNQIALVLMAAYGDAEDVDYLLTLGAKVNARDDNQETALYATFCNDSGEDRRAIAQSLIEAGAYFNTENDELNNVLHTSILDGDVEAVTILIKAGAAVHNNDLLKLENPDDNVSPEMTNLIRKALIDSPYARAAKNLGLKL